MHLATTAITDFWDPADENLLLGPWCAPRGRPGWEPFRRRMLPDPWRDMARFERAVDYCAEFSERLLGPVSRHLNAALKTAHSERYWRILVYPWIEASLQEMYDHYAHVADAFALEPKLSSTTLAPSSYRTPRDTWEHVSWSLDDPYSLQLFSQLLEGRGFAEKAYAWSPTPSRPEGLKASVKRAASWALARAVPPGAGQIMLGDLHLTRGETARVAAGTGFKALPLWIDLPPSAYPPAAFDERRAGLARIVEPRDEFERLYLLSMVRNFPRVYLEGYAAAREHVLSRLWRTPRAFMSAVAWHYLDAYKLAAAECAERGSQLWGLQHGGSSYGMMRQAPSERLERAATDRYFAWGWASLDGDPKVRDLPSPQLARVRRDGAGEGILIVSTNLDLHNHRLLTNSSNSRATDYILRQARLWKALPERLKPASRLRLHKDYGVRHEDRLRELCPDMRFDDTTARYERRLRESRLLIIDYPTMTFQEALAADAPCLMTWDPANWSFRDSARPYFDRLKAVGLLFDEPEQAAAQAARVYDDPRPWWDEPERRAARLDFTRKFAYRRDDWLDCWVGEFDEALARKS